MGDEKSKAYNRVIQIEYCHSDGSLSNNQYPSAVINHIHHLDNEAQSEAFASLSISTTIQARRLAQVRQGAYYPRCLELNCKCQHMAPRPAALRTRQLIHLQHPACQDTSGPSISNLSRLQGRPLVGIAAASNSSQQWLGSRCSNIAVCSQLHTADWLWPLPGPTSRRWWKSSSQHLAYWRDPGKIADIWQI